MVWAVALQLATSTGAGIEEGAVRALTTLRQVMPSRLRHRVDALTVMPAGTSSLQVEPHLLLVIGAAVRAREVLRFDYPGPGDGTRRVEAHHLVARSGRWYLVGWDLDREDWRTFRVDRMIPRIPNGPRFTEREVPGGDVAAFVRSRFRGAADGDGSWPCVGEVLLDLPVEAVVPYVADGVVEAIGAGRCRVVLGAWSWVGLAATLGRFDAELEVVGPAELAAACAELGARFAQAGRSSAR